MRDRKEKCRWDLEELSALGLMLEQSSKIEKAKKWERVPDSPYNQVTLQ